MYADSRSRSRSDAELAAPRVVVGGTRRFITGFVLAVVVTMLPFIGVSARLVALGETDLFDTEVSLAAERIHGPLVESFAEYKLRRALGLRPEVLLFGTSRTLRWRGSFFDGCQGNPSCFYNASGAMDTTLTADVFIRRLLLTYTPRVLLIDIAHFNFDPRFVLNDHVPPDIDPSFPDRVHHALVNEEELLRSAQNDAELRSVLVGRVPAPRGYRGVRAILRGEGFLPDGAYSNGSALRAYDDSDTIRRVRDQGERFEWFERADERSLAELQDVVTVAQKHGVTVLAFVTPYSDGVVDAVAAQPGLRSGWADVEARVEQMMGAHGIPFVRFKNISAVGCEPGETLDGFHPGEVCSARLLVHLLGEPALSAALAPYVHADRLAQLIDQRSSALLIGPP